MLNPSPATRVFLALAPVDLRGSFNRLSALAQNQLAQVRFTWPTGGGACGTWRHAQLSALLNGLEVWVKDGWHRR